MFHTPLDQTGVFAQGGAEKRLAGDEHHNEFGGRVKLLEIALSSQRTDVVAHLARMIFQQQGPVIVIVAFDRSKISIH